MTGALRTWFPLAVFSVLWLDLIRQLSYEWSTSDQYAYGWFVPFFSAALLWRRWLDRPGGKDESRKQKAEIFKDHSPLTSGFSFQLSAFPISAFALPAFCFLLFLLLLPLRVIYEINADWPLISWPYTLIVVFATLYAFFLAGGWPWVRHFAFPICFILVAVRWPWRVEFLLTQGLMRVVAAITVEVLGWLNIPALQRGNLIELATGTVGINEACSGIRSMQSTIMASLFLGELYLLRWPLRLIFLALGVLLAFLFNVVRALFLSWQASSAGLNAIDKWHDPAGFTITIACTLLLWALAVWIRKRTTDHGPRTTGLPDQRAPGPSHSQPSTLDSQPSSNSQLSVVSVQAADSQLSTSTDLRPPTSDPSLQPSAFSLQPSLPRRYLLAVGWWAICILVVTEVWYRSHEKEDAGVLHWSVTLPETKATFQQIEASPRTLELLRYDTGAAAKWKEEDGSEWTVYFLRWEGKSMQSVVSARDHRPEICLPSAGFQQVSISGIEYFETGRLRLPYRKSAYSGQGQMAYVFYCLWQDGDERRKGASSLESGHRLLAAIEGRRRFRQQTLEIVTTGYSNLAEAERAVRQRLPNLIRIEGPAVPATSPSDH